MNGLNIEKKSLDRLLLSYSFGLEEILTKVRILQGEFNLIHKYNPIEHVKSRIKSQESLCKKLQRKDLPMTLESVRNEIKDIAGIRIVCSFKSDIYRVAGMLIQQNDIEVVEYDDYIDNPKDNGYQSLHLTLEVPVFLSDRQERVAVEVQIRTIAMDFWASLEHKIYYKHENMFIPEDLVTDLKNAAKKVSILDNQMEMIHKKMNEFEMTYT